MYLEEPLKLPFRIAHSSEVLHHPPPFQFLYKGDRFITNEMYKVDADIQKLS
jgi:hypothetical protein